MTVQRLIILLPFTIFKLTGFSQVTGPSSSHSPFLLPSGSGVTITSLLTTGNSINNYSLSGLPDGMGGWDNGDGTFTLLVNHEIPPTTGVVRAHGSTGAFVSKWIINKSSKAVLNGSDLIQNVHLWAGNGYTVSNAANPSPEGAFARFCSADLASYSAFYNPITGKGTQERIFMTGEENGTEGRAFANIAIGANAGNSYELPHLGKFTWENAVASPYSGDKTVVAGLDDNISNGQLYFYIGVKTNTGTVIDQAGLANGKLYGLKINNLSAEQNASVPSPNTPFSLVDLGQVHTLTGVALNNLSVTMGVMDFFRPEDGAWDPQNLNDFYFVTTNSIGNPSRLWRVRFANIFTPELGGTITAVLDGTEGQSMLDNIAIDNSGHIVLQEDPGDITYLSKIWQYSIATDVLIEIAQHDPAQFISTGTNYLGTQNEEASGIIDAQNILGPGMFLFDDQAHVGHSNPAIVEWGQLLSMYNPATALANPEVNIAANGSFIMDGSTTTSTLDNTEFGSTQIGTSITNTFAVQNSGAGKLVIHDVAVSGNNASEFNVNAGFPFPVVVSPGTAHTFSVQFTPASVGTRTALVHVVNTDFNEDWYDFKISGDAQPAGVKSYSKEFSSIVIFPNPAKDKTVVNFILDKRQRVQVEIHDQNGKAIKKCFDKFLEAGYNEMSLNITELPKGIYIVKVSAFNQSSALKLVID